MYKRIALLLLTLSWMATAAHSQIAISPYSHYGLGDIFSTSSTRSFGMGRVGIGAYDQASINRLNPASYADLRLTTFDFNGFVTYSKQSSNINEQGLSTSGFHNVQLAFSNRKGFGIVAGIAPYSSLGYDVRVRDSIQVDTTHEAYTAKYSATGGLNQLYFGFGVRFLRRVQAGINLSYAFGSNTYQWESDYDDATILTGTAEKNVSLKGFSPQLGLQYGDTIKVKVQVARSKEIEEQKKALLSEQDALGKELEAAKKESSKVDAWESGKQAKADELEAQRKVLDANVKNLMVKERENAKEIGKLQDQVYRIDKKRKDLLREIKTRRKENTDLQARIILRQEKTTQRIAALDQELKEIQEGKKESTVTKTRSYLVRLGGTFDPGFSLKGSQLYRYTNGGVRDTLFDGEGKVSMPSKLGFGFTFAKTNKWMIGADLNLQDWSKFRFFDETNSLTNSMSVNVGGEWIPDLTSNNFGKKIAYRLGGFYNASFLTLAGNPITEVGVTAGVGLPIGFYNPVGQSYSRINLGFNLSRRGTLDSNLLQELTFQFRLGVNLNDVWFIKRRVD
ncbi:MAG TPA: hypothetical protein VHS96_02915 [Bacteroidia bacterium]|nr:hypothetical protein [Bacteroidia bacterium]